MQVDAFLKEGIDSKNIYADISSGAKSERKGLDELLSKLRGGDTIVDRIARSLSVAKFKDPDRNLLAFKDEEVFLRQVDVFKPN